MDLAIDQRGLRAEAPAPRAIGAALVSARLRDGRSTLADLRQQGSAKALLPRGPGDMLEAVLLNTAGGITGGDRFSYAGAAWPDAWLSLSTQAAERAYRAEPHETGRMDVTLRAETGARIDWLPQETILYDRSALARRLEVDLAADARLLAVEAVVFGRTAMGERLSRLRFSDQWRVRREGRLIYADALRLHGSAAVLDRPATLAGARAIASILLAAPDAELHLAPVRALLPATAGASLIRPGVLAIRMIAADGFALRRHLVPVLEALRQAPLPTVWTL